MKNLNETAQEILEILGQKETNNGSLELVSDANSSYLKDLKVNFKTSLKSDYLSDKEIALIGIAIASNEKTDLLIAYFNQLAIEVGASLEEIGEAIACSSLLSSNNVLYRFRHFVNKEKYSQIPARLRMNIMLKPVLGKELFELISLAVSAVNGCEMCVNSHEHSLIELGTKEERIFDSIRLSATIVSLSKLV